MSWPMNTTEMNPFISLFDNINYHQIQFFNMSFRNSILLGDSQLIDLLAWLRNNRLKSLKLDLTGCSQITNLFIENLFLFIQKNPVKQLNIFADSTRINFEDNDLQDQILTQFELCHQERNLHNSFGSINLRSSSMKILHDVEDKQLDLYTRSDSKSSKLIFWKCRQEPIMFQVTKGLISL
jgi:hypothetical protein